MTALPLNGETWLICGGRDFTDSVMFNNAMSELVHLKGFPSRIVEGGAKGADALAAQWGDRHAIPVAELRADWKTHGKAAGAIRNQKMLDEQKPQFVVAFPGGRGTADMVARARKEGIDVAEVFPQPGTRPASFLCDPGPF